MAGLGEAADGARCEVVAFGQREIGLSTLLDGRSVFETVPSDVVAGSTKLPIHSVVGLHVL